MSQEDEFRGDSTEVRGDQANGVASNNSNGASDDMKDSERTVCRDFLRNVCHRGPGCKFIHPNDAIHGDLVFCHDYQNIGCNRYDCKFLHGTKDEEKRYLDTGKLPANVRVPADTNEPVCKDFLKRQCHRGRRCKFRHVDPDQSERSGFPPAPIRDSSATYYDDRYGDEGTYPRTDRCGERYGTECWSPSPKRRRVSLYEEDIFSLERENRMLRSRMDDLQKQVKDLMSTNEFLLQQNAQLRISKQQTIPTAAITADPITSEPVGVGIVPVSSIITMSSNSTPLVSYPIVSQSLRYTARP